MADVESAAQQVNKYFFFKNFSVKTKTYFFKANPDTTETKKVTENTEDSTVGSRPESPDNLAPELLMKHPLQVSQSDI